MAKNNAKLTIKKVEKIKGLVTGFDFTIKRDGHVTQFIFTGYPTVNGRRPSLDDILAHYDGQRTLRFDKSETRDARSIRLEDRALISGPRPYASWDIA